MRHRHITASPRTLTTTLRNTFWSLYPAILRGALLGLILSWPILTYAERVKDIATVSGVRTNQLVGYGLVVGLDGTGDQTQQAQFTVQSLLNMLQQFGITIPPGVNPQLQNVAAVSVHADLPAFGKPGQMIDVTVSSIANSKCSAAI